jgi:hypothetical protein
MGNYSCCHPDNLPRQQSDLENLPRQKRGLEQVKSFRTQGQVVEQVDDMRSLLHDANRLDANVQKWHYLARTNLWQKERVEQQQLRKAIERLKSDGISQDELEQTAYRAVMNFSHFRGMKPGSTDLLKCLGDTETANICQVVISCAGLRGWVEANLPTVVMQLDAIREDADGNTEIACCTIGGNPNFVRCASDWTVREFRSDLAEKLHEQVGSIRLTLPNATLLSESHEDMQVFHLVRAASAQA